MKNHIHPAIVTKQNIQRFKDQLQSIGFSFDWDREINTTDPEYYNDSVDLSETSRKRSSLQTRNAD